VRLNDDRNLMTGKGRALITGASGGIGADFARVFAREGYDLVLTARGKDRLETLAEELRAKYKVDVCVLPADLSQVGAAKALAERLDADKLQVDVLVNNAGFGLLGPFAELDAEKQSEMMRLNIVALTELTRFLLPGMLSRRKGRILHVASIAAFQPGPLMAVYFATKAYVFSFSLALKEELVGTGVDVTCLCPGATETKFAETASAADSKLFKQRKPMTSMEVAEEGYRALQKGEGAHITGWLNRLLVFSTRFAPASMTAKIAKAMMEKA
jgi:short-subunit dehydrogenase